MTDPFEALAAELGNADMLVADVANAYDELDALVHAGSSCHTAEEMIDTYHQFEGGVTRRVIFERREPTWFQVKAVVDGRPIGKGALTGRISYWHADDHHATSHSCRGWMHLLSAIGDPDIESQFILPDRQIITSRMALMLLHGALEGITAELGQGTTSAVIQSH